MEEKIKILEERIKILEETLERYILIDRELNYRCLRDYCYDKGDILTPSECRKLATKITVYCNKRKIPIYKGMYNDKPVNTYPINVLRKFFRDDKEDEV